MSTIPFKANLMFVTFIAAAFLTFSSAVYGQAFSGSIQTSDIDGLSVNQNLFTSKELVYLNGGPQNLSSSGLPIGTYYFQVTTPNGVLLSTDPASCRQLVVALNSSGKGVVMGMAAIGSGPNQRPATQCNNGQHPNGNQNPNNGSIPVKLLPFNDTTNSGGEYKVWLIRKTSNTIVTNDDTVAISFRGSDAKTDNFKVRPENNGTPTPTPTPDPGLSYTLKGCKFYDRNANGVRDDGEQYLMGVRILVTIDGVADPDPIVTGPDGCWERTGIAPGSEYLVQEILPHTGMEPSYYWYQSAPSEISVPDPNGSPGDYIVIRGYWNQAIGGTPDPNGVIVIDGLDFGNLCFGPNTTGKTKGWWTNKNGETELNTGAYDTSVYPVGNAQFPEAGTNMVRNLNFLSRHNLFGEATNKKVVVTVAFDPTNYPDLKAWFNNANAYNMSYMLSAQLAATSLNVRLMHFPDSQIVDASSYCDPYGYCLGITTIGNVRYLANVSLGDTGGNTTISGSPFRDSQELMKNFMDGINNNWIPFAQSAPCPIVYP